MFLRKAEIQVVRLYAISKILVMTVCYFSKAQTMCKGQAKHSTLQEW